MWHPFWNHQKTCDYCDIILITMRWIRLILEAKFGDDDPSQKWSYYRKKHNEVDKENFVILKYPPFLKDSAICYIVVCDSQTWI